MSKKVHAALLTICVLWCIFTIPMALFLGDCCTPMSFGDYFMQYTFIAFGALFSMMGIRNLYKYILNGLRSIDKSEPRKRDKQ